MEHEEEFWDEQKKYINDLLCAGEISDEEHGFMIGYYEDELRGEEE